MASNSINDYGPKMWYLIHTFAGKYSFIHSQNYITFIKTLSNLMPCFNCRLHFKKILKEHPVEQHMHSKHKLLYWTFVVHNIVNERLGKKLKKYSPVESYYICKNRDREVDITNHLWGVLFTLAYSNNKHRLEFMKFFRATLNMLEPYHRDPIEQALINIGNNPKLSLEKLVYNIYKTVENRPHKFNTLDSFYKNAGCTL
uniref:thiol oxidase n=1 Tax=viral metagenome TaxID=1070528 RepID=A0A6C0J8G0_9ZZZZ